ncbi:Diaminopimelate decarboxylase [hydrothermal vent metagenome]|uniref:Diaminopimelate decarboxylase n=1 Tax=hydrothermal vent metagenome TaxID=652676 RepID=A0A3B1CID1_9ZZZZ
MKQALKPEDWGITIGNRGEAMLKNFDLTDLAKKYGTPIHIVNEPRLRYTAGNFVESMQKTYDSKVSVYYAFKCNSVPYVIDIIRKSRLNAEVATEYEFDLALRVGYSPNQIIVNGPNKMEKFIEKCVESEVRFLVVDSLDELHRLENISKKLGRKINILLRINPNYIPSGMNSGSATASRKGSLFGLDLQGGEAFEAVSYLTRSNNLIFSGIHFHIGTGIKNPKDYSNAINKLSSLFKHISTTGLKVKVIDVGGGIASPTSRELTTKEMLLYQAFNYLPVRIGKLRTDSFREFGDEISKAVKKYFEDDELPELIFEPGRSITSQNQFLLITVHQVKRRKGVKTWLITDGGLGTVTMPTYYEYHEILLCNDLHRPKTERVSINGSCCFSSDIVYKNKLMPKVFPGEVIAVMDTGAYFTSLESQFGFQRPAIVAVTENEHELVRERESIAEMTNRDKLNFSKSLKGAGYEIFNH